ncbi:MAG: ATP-binding cassette domain-containing protein, partial [Collinsella intestinalis]
MTSSRVGAPLIEARNITKHYDGFTLQGVSLTVEPGQIVGFIGQNGAGKSTTIKALLGIIGIDAGDARILGVDARGLSGADAAVKERVGVVFDTVSMPPHIKIVEVGKLMDRAYQTWDARVFEEYLHRFKLDSKKAIKELSRGMGMKLSLACALAHNPQVLILD